MDKDLLQPAATIVAGMIAHSGSGTAPLMDIKGAFIHAYRELEKAKKEIEGPRTARISPLRT